ncbi:uncharacterized protein LY89DRAFT_681336 [Mollisia scopiformis]|uniref:Uncharacterized protein n=1 Tax=Mollisia scopiformis TaxID=149040 RepID=A0A194XPJ0_MOLSC|nr:uncharacterized protein LY89DRAFT_681336 [Mollisia scopiformis]KUJ21989.1 hypothetical protein LY89DRAFT_681336 [Mollisia scopiformis]
MLLLLNGSNLWVCLFLSLPISDLIPCAAIAMYLLSNKEAKVTQNPIPPGGRVDHCRM